VDDLPDEITDLANSLQDFCSDSERQKVKDLTTVHEANLSAIRSRIDCINDQIARLRSHRQQLRSRRDQEIKHIEILKSIVSPIRRVPTDVLCEIFEHCLPEMSTGGIMNVLSDCDAPLLLCQVCSKWRRMALAFPPLWKSMALGADCWFDCETKVVMSIQPSISRILTSWFARAGSGPLSLGLDLRNRGPSFKHRSRSTLKLKDVFTRLPHSRLEHLSLSTDYPSDTYFLSAISQKFTQLQSISLRTGGGHEGDSVLPPDCLLQSAPRLRSAELHNFISPDIFPRHLIPWSQLTHLRIEVEFGESMWYTLVCLCTNLQHGIFSINDAEDHVRIPISNHDILLSHLVDLTLHLTRGATIPRFRRLVFPALRRLQWLFDRSFELSYDHNDSYLPSAERDSLKTLVIAGVIGIMPPQLISLLSSASSITELHLSVMTDYCNLFSVLATSSSSHQLLPKLDVLHCDIVIIINVDTFLEALASFVRSRWWDELDSPASRTIARLRRLTLNFEVTEQMRDLRDRVSRILEPFTDRGLPFVLDTCPNLRHHLNLRKMMTYEVV